MIILNIFAGKMIDDGIKIRVKIIAGYLLLTVIIAIAGWWIYANVLKLATNSPDEYERIYEKSAITNSLIYHLYQVDYKGNQFTQSYSQSTLKEYNESLRILYLSIDSLKSKIASPHQYDLLQKLYELLEEKNKNTLELAKIRRTAGSSDYYTRHIENVIKKNAKDSIEKTIVISRVSNDTIKVSPTEKRKFFQRLGDVFSPKETPPPSVKVITSVKTDTLRSKQTPSDSIAKALSKAKANMLTTRLAIRKTVNSKLQKLIVTEQQISAQISLIIAELNQEATLNNAAEIDAKRATLHNAGRIIAIVAVVALLIIVLFLFFIFKDISNSTRYKRQLELARIHAEELMTSRHKMLLNISHDIKAPLCSITGYLDLMSSSPDADVNKWSDSMKISSSYIMDLLTNLLEYARLETGKSVTYISSFDFDAMVGDVMTIFRPIANDKNITLSCDTNTLVGIISSDAIRIRQIVMNLISNAVKFTDSGGVNISYWLDESNQLKICVSDSGRGIESSKLNAIFDEFTRDEKVEGVEGTGLGLAVVRGSITLLGGTIAVESEVQRGSVFNVSIPVERAELPLNTIPVKNTPLTILIVDDDKLQLRMMTEMMSRSGHTIHCASTLETVNQIVATHKIDLVLTDLQMGEFSGFKLLEGLRAKEFKKPIIVVSASGQANDRDLKEAGFSDFLRKPFSLYDLNKIVYDNVSTKQEIPSLYELMDGDEEAIKEIMELFIGTTMNNIELLKEYLRDENMNEAQRLCHKMLPMFLQLQLNEVAGLLREVDNGDFNLAKIARIINLTKDIIAQYRTA